MTASWLRLDPAVRAFPQALGLVAANAGLMLGFATGLQASHGDPGTGPFSWNFLICGLALWGGTMAYLASRPCRTRCGEMALALPVPARRLWLTHTLAVVAGGVLMVATGGALLAAVRQALLPQLGADRLAFDPGLGALVAQLASGVALAAVLAQAVHPSRQQIPARHHGTRLALCFALLPGLLLSLSPAPAWTALGPLALAAAVGFRVYRGLPHTLRVAGPLPEGAVEEGTAEDGGQVDRDIAPGPLRYPWLLFVLLWRDSPKPIPYMVPVMAATILLMFGVVYSGLLGAWIDPDLDMLRWMFPGAVCYCLLAFAWLPVSNLAYPDSLPVSRRALFAVMVLPPLAVLLAGYAAGRAAVPILAEPRQGVELVERDGHYYLYVPYEACRISWGAAPPAAGSPWGESHPPAAASSLYPGSSVTLYSPFSTPPGSSVEFVALQISRAVEVVHGVSIPPAEIRERYLEVDEAGDVVPRGGKLDLLQDYPGLRRTERTPWLLFTLLVTAPPWFLLLGVFLLSVRARVSQRLQKTVLWTLAGLSLASYIAFLMGEVTGLLRASVIQCLLEWGTQVARDRIPGGLAMLWAAVLLASAGTYRFAEWRFLRAEAAPRSHTA